jgi:MFS family permease
VIILFGMIRYRSISKKNVDEGGLFLRLKQGINFLKVNMHVLLFGLTSYMLFAFTLVEIHIILPSYVDSFLRMDGNIYASAEIYYSIGAILSGFLILKVFRKLDYVISVMLLMLLVSFLLYFMTFYNIIWVFFLGNLIIGITNAGVRILRTTYLFNNIPNNLIGRTNSVFNSINIMIRMLLIGLFSLSFFQIGDNIRFAYLVGCVLLLLTVVVLFLSYKYIISRSVNHS